MRAALLVCIGVATFASGVLWYTALPIMQVDLDGNCRRVMMIEEGHEVVRPCSMAIGKIHLTEYVGR